MFFVDPKGLAKTVAELGRLVKMETRDERRALFVRELQQIADDPSADNGTRRAAFAIVSQNTFTIR
jgi:hypothetical protein